jgi:hypothetical protein
MAGDGLYVTTAGFWATINWQYAAGASTLGASTIINNGVGNSEFSTAGRIETNTLSITFDFDTIPFRLGDAIEDVIKQGDASGNIWKGGVYADQKFIYEPIPTTIDYILRDGALYDKGGIPIDLALINPGFYVRDTNAPPGGQLPGTSNIWDDPQVSYCDEVEFVWPDTLRMKFPGESMIVVALGRGWTTQDKPFIRRYGIPFTRETWFDDPSPISKHVIKPYDPYGKLTRKPEWKDR